MLVNPREVALVLFLVIGLIAAKQFPFLTFLPLTAITGVVCFAFAIYLSLRLFAFELDRMRRE